MKSNFSKEFFDFKLFKRILRYINPYRFIFYLSVFFSISLAFFSILRPIIIEYTIDNFIIGKNKELLLKFIIILFIILILESVFQFLFIYSANWISQSIIKDIRQKLFDKILSFRLKYFNQNPIGSLVTRTVSDIETISEIFSQGVLVIFSDLFKIFIIIIWMINRDTKLTLISLSVFPILILSTKFFQKLMKIAFEKERFAISRLNAFLQEHISGMKIVQIFSREKQEFKKFKQLNENFKNSTIQAIWYFSIFLPIIEIISALSLSLMVWYGGINILKDGQITPGLMVSFILLINMLFRPIRNLSDRINILQRGVVASRRVFKIIDLKYQIKSTNNLNLKNFRGNIEFSDLTFSYNKNETVLSNISFKVNQGEKLAIVGETGSGKSTIINLLLRFYEFSSGKILLDNQDIRKFSQSSIRKNFALVLQEIFLFSDTILNNIILDSKITSDEVIRASKEIGLFNFINEFPGGFEYNVRERGVMLSSGQRQLISFLRAYVINPKVIILDEATSSIDSYTEDLIQKALKKITYGKTTIIIAHRLSTVKDVDKILVLEKGKIVECGNHKDLIKSDSVYKKIFNSQIFNI